MKETTLGQVPTGSSFWFGNVKFTKGDSIGDELISCTINGGSETVHITCCAWVAVSKDTVLKNETNYKSKDH